MLVDVRLVAWSFEWNQLMDFEFHFDARHRTLTTTSADFSVTLRLDYEVWIGDFFPVAHGAIIIFAWWKGNFFSC